MHIESSHVTPRAFARPILPHGTTTIVTDPYVVAIVAGEEGVPWKIRASHYLPERIFYSIPSSVPATAPAPAVLNTSPISIVKQSVNRLRHL